MKASALRTILLIKAVEEQDADGAILPLAEREAATREAVRRWPATQAGMSRSDRERQAWRILEARAGDLYARLVERHPVVVRTVMLESRAPQVTVILLGAAFLLGLVLSVLDSRVRIEIVAFPLLGLVLWNLAVYAALCVGALRRSRRSNALAGVARDVTWPVRWAWRRAATLIKRAAFYHRPLAAALRRFSDEWWPLAQPLLWRHGERVFHAGAAFVALGLVAGFYVRGIGLEYRAGWESTFLGPAQVRAILQVMYGPAAALTGIALPGDDAAVTALHWRGGAGGGPAAPWIHLMAATALLLVVVPRLLLALAATVGLARAAATLTPPDALLAYARSVLGASDAALPADAVRVVPYAYQPAAAAVAGVRKLLEAAFGTGTRVDVDAQLAYGDEAACATRMRGDSVDVHVVLCSLSATPEAENHGSVLAQACAMLRAAPAHARLLVLVDESPYLAVVGSDASLAGRVEQRREAWRSFVAQHGLAACLVDLAALGGATDVDPALSQAVRRCCRGASQ
ncbi:MAG TPA: DUF2868 domain-containing protein [Steroidobacteraceae bacterium]